MNKFFLLLLIFASSLFAQDFTGIRIYINPGHGGHDSDDRYISATGFWESEGNLAKGLYLKSILDSLNATTKISRTTNTSSDDLPLSSIVADANNFDADYFQAIHSNGGNGTSNYTLVLFQGKDNAPTYPEAKTMGSYIADEIFKAHRTTTRYNRGDADFYGTGQPYLGVFKGLTMPGTLSEGSFHDYIPESWRLKNNAYLKHEAWAITKAFAKYFNLSTLPYGQIAGISRDKDETVSYYYISTTQDKYQPTNLVKAVLMPDSIVYSGDSYNNGFFLFDRVPPGDYTLIVGAENYKKDTVQVTATANQITFADQFLIAEPDYSIPTVTSYSPTVSEGVRLDNKIILNFNVKMNQVSTEQAFSITPKITGSFTWENNYKRLIFTPSDFLLSATNYKVSLNIFAKSFYDVLLDSAFSFNFKTRTSLKLLSTYPDKNESEISSTVKVILQFDAEINQNSIGGNIYFQDAQGNDVSVKDVDFSNNRIMFEPLNALSENSQYQIKLLSGISDNEGANLGSDTSITFTTGSSIKTEGTVIFDFENIGDWLLPTDGSNYGIDSLKTSFKVTTDKFVTGTQSGKLNYSFSGDSSGICRIYNSDEPLITSGSQNNFGIWVFGDLSNNILEYWFGDSDNNNVEIIVDTLDWTGWKFKEVDLSSFTNLKFNSIVIAQTSSGSKEGQIYFDDAQTDVITGLQINNNVSNEFRLFQNYPNPFNPTTKISYEIPNSVKGNVKLIVYDILGRQVKTLVNKIQKPGTYDLSFDASELSSGIYYYQLKVGEFLQTKKMLLLK